MSECTSADEVQTVDLAESVDDIIARMRAQPGGTLVAKLQVTRKATGAVENWTLVFKEAR